MAEIIVSKDPGYYATGQSVTITFPAGTRKAIITTGDRPPVLTEILAYDTGPIPPGTTDEKRPFLAVTQDGKGNVVYDGGFPKFYNVEMASSITFNPNGTIATLTFPPNPPSTRAELTPASQYLLNELNFIASVKKTGLGNRKILFVNNTTRLAIYNIWGSHYNPDPVQTADGSLSYPAYGFRDTFDAVCRVGNWIPTYYDNTDAGGDIDLSTEYLDQFAAVVAIASRECPSMALTGFSDQFALNLAQYRRFGNGVAIITDHCGGNYTSLQDALERSSIFGAGGTKLAQHYDAYFSGNVDRSPISVGAIRAQGNGDHPLFAGMADSEMISAGGSESLTVPENTTANEVPTTPYTVDLTTPGAHRINVLVQLEDGTIITRNLRYVVISPSDIVITDYFDRQPGPDGITTYKRAIDYSIQMSGINETLYGQVMVDSMLVGWFNTRRIDDKWNTSYAPLAGQGCAMIINNGQRLRFIVNDPFEYEVSAMMNIPDSTPYYLASGSVASFLEKVTSHPYFIGITVPQITTDLTGFANKYYPVAQALGNFVTGQWWKIVGKGRAPLNPAQLVDPIQLGIYTSAAAWEAAKPPVAPVGSAVIIAPTNTVWYWDDASISWLLHPSPASSLFGVNRNAINTLDSSKWIVQSSTTVPA